MADPHVAPSILGTFTVASYTNALVRLSIPRSPAVGVLYGKGSTISTLRRGMFIAIRV